MNSKHLRAAACIALLLASSRSTSAQSFEPVYEITLRAEAALDRADALATEIARTYRGAIVAVHPDRGSFSVRMSAGSARAAATDSRVSSISKLTDAAPTPRRPGPISPEAETMPWASGVAYSYDASGNITKIATDTFIYDVGSRVVEATTNGIKRTYEYDGFGNRTKCSQASTDCQTHTIAPATNRISGSGMYDAAGNVKSLNGRSYTYDAAGMQISDVSTCAQPPCPARENVYTANDQRIAVYFVNAYWRWTIRDIGGNVIRELTSANGGVPGTESWVWVKDYVWRDGLLLATRQIPTGGSSATTYHYHLDHLGTPRRITNSSDQIVGYHDYHPYGPEVGGGKHEPSLTVFKYTALERDVADAVPSELDYVHARYYSPTVGRFLSPDPIQGEVRKPASWNRYSYAGSNPLRYIDPTGLVLYAATTEAQNDICALIGPNCQQYVKFDASGKVTITASQADLKANEALKLFYEMSQSQKVYGAWVGTQVPAATKTLTLSDSMKTSQVVNLSTTLRTDLIPQATQHLPPAGFDGAIGIFSGYPSIASIKGVPAFRPLVLFHELAENYHRTEHLKQYKEAHPYAIGREHILRLQQPQLQQYSGWGKFDVTLKP